MKRTVTIVTAAILTISGSLAHAASSSYALLSNLSIKLYDLDTNDGITPSISFTGASIFSAMEDQNFPSIRASNSAFQNTPFGSGSAISTTSTSFSIATGTGNGISAQSTLENNITGALYAAGGTDVKKGSGNIYTAGSFSEAFWENQFSISANTLVEFSATGTAYSTVLNSANSSSSTHEFSAAWTRLATARFNSAGERIDFLEYFIDSYGNKVNQESAGFNSGTMIARFQNDSSGTIKGVFSAGVIASSYFENIPPSPIPSIPEPQTALLFAAGTWIVGRMSSRKNGKH